MPRKFSCGADRSSWTQLHPSEKAQHLTTIGMDFIYQKHVFYLFT